MKNQATRESVLQEEARKRQFKRELPIVIGIAIAAAFTFAHALLGTITC
jgi:hypothetical protein